MHEEPSDADLLRFLIARKWDLRKAKRMFDEYQEWRREWPQSRVRPVDVPVSVGHRKAFVLPRPDVRGFPAVVLVASRHMMYEVGKGKGSQETTYAFQVFCFDHAIAHADRLGSQKLTIVLDLEGLGWRNLDLNCLKNIVPREAGCLPFLPPAQCLLRALEGREAPRRPADSGEDSFRLQCRGTSGGAWASRPGPSAPWRGHARRRNAARRVHPALIRTAAGRGSLLSSNSTHERNTYFLSIE